MAREPANFSQIAKNIQRGLQGHINIPGQQSQAITQDLASRILGSDEEFMSRYKSFEEEYFRLLSDTKNRRLGASVRDIDLERVSGQIRLSYLNLQSQKELQRLYMENVLRIPELLQEAGIPGVEFESQNLYTRLLQFNVGKGDHVGLSVLRRSFFNIDPNQLGLEGIRLGLTLPTAQALSEIKASKGFSPTKKIQGLDGERERRTLYLDVETTGVTEDSQIRQFAYRINEGDAVVKSFANEQMDIAAISKSGQSTLLSRSKFFGEVDEMGDGGVNFVNEAKNLLNDMLNVDHISAHNAYFDINKFLDTLGSLDAYHRDEEAVKLMDQFKVRLGEEGYVVDTLESAREYMQRKVQDVPGLDYQRFASQLLGPETLSQLGFGGSTAYAGIEQLSLNTNLFQLLEQDAQSPLSQAVFKGLRKGSHEADTDTALAAALDRYRADEKLELRFNFGPDGKFTPVGGELSEFEKYARSIILKSRAINPMTNMASVQHASDAALRYLKTDEGLRNVSLFINKGKFQELGIEEGAEGILRHSNEGFVFARFGQREAELITNQDAARSLIRQTLTEAEEQGLGVESELKIGKGAGQISTQVMRNTADETIFSLGLSILQGSQIQRTENARNAITTAGIQLNDRRFNFELFERIAGITSEQYGGRNAPQTIIQRIKSGLSGDAPIRRLRNPVQFGEETAANYAVNLARAGMPFASLDDRTRVMAVGMSQATASLAEAAQTNLTSARNAKLLSEFGLSYAKMQTRTYPLGAINEEGSIDLRSKPIVRFEDLFEIGTSQVEGENEAARMTLSVKAFAKNGEPGADIMSTDLNRFTLSYVEDIKDGVTTRRFNYVWAANKTLNKKESKLLATQMLGNPDTQQALLRDISFADEDLTREVTELINQNRSFSSLSKKQQVLVRRRASEHIRDRGIVTATIEDQNTIDAMIQLFKDQQIDLVDNDVRLSNLVMRLGHADKESGLLLLSPMVDAKVAEATGLTSEVLQKETYYAIKAQEEAGNQLLDSAARSRVGRVVMDSQNSSVLDNMIDTGTRAIRDFRTPMTDFYIKNKKPIGFAALGLAAAGVGYYMSKQYRDNKIYSETMEQQPTQFTSGVRRTSLNSPRSTVQSTRRDPLVTAGVVGNLDRSKVGHYKMGNDKYNHLYGG